MLQDGNWSLYIYTTYNLYTIHFHCMEKAAKTFCQISPFVGENHMGLEWHLTNQSILEVKLWIIIFCSQKQLESAEKFCKDF